METITKKTQFTKTFELNKQQGFKGIGVFLPARLSDIKNEVFKGISIKDEDILDVSIDVHESKLKITFLTAHAL